VVLQFVLLQ